MTNYATRLVDESADPVAALTVQQIIAAATTNGTPGADGSDGEDGLNAADYGVFTVSTDTVAVDRGWLFSLYDHTIAANETNAPPPGSVFASSVDGLIYHRLADGSTNQLDNASSEYGSSGSASATSWGVRDGYYYYGNHVTDSAIFPGDAVMYYLPFEIDEEVTWTKIGIHNNLDTAAGHHVGLGVYTNQNMQPHTLLLDCGYVQCQTSGTKEADIVLTMPAGKYWLAFRANYNGISVIGNQPAEFRGSIALPGNDDPTDSGAPLTYYAVYTGTDGQLPPMPVGTLVPQSGVSPRVWLRRV